jgi:hypothetical protein
MVKMGVNIGAVLILALAPSAFGLSRAVAAPQTGTVVAFRNALPGSYELRRVRLRVDGVVRYEGAGAFDTPLEVGRHVVAIEADYRLHDPVLPYVNGYAVELRSAEHVMSQPGQVVVARAIGSRDVTIPMAQRAQLIWR